MGSAQDNLDTDNGSVVPMLNVGAPVDMIPIITAAADSIIQSSWATANASRFFADSVAARYENITRIGNGTATAWISMLGGQTRTSSTSDHAGSNSNLSGSIAGVELYNETSSIGLALGKTENWARVTFFRAKTKLLEETEEKP